MRWGEREQEVGIKGKGAGDRGNIQKGVESGSRSREVERAEKER